MEGGAAPAAGSGEDEVGWWRLGLRSTAEPPRSSIIPFTFNSSATLDRYIFMQMIQDSSIGNVDELLKRKDI